MDEKSLFRSLVTNKYLPDFDYFSSRFSFLTVFYLSPYCSHCCPCAFEHEYLDYISDSGEIDEVVYEKILNCITHGKCPHVDGAPYNYVMQTRIYGIHIAAAVGTEQVVQGYRDEPTIGPTGALFGINPIHMAVLKNQSDMLRQLLHIYPQPRYRQFFFYSYRESENSCNIQVEIVSLIELCTRMESSELLRTFLCESPSVLGISDALKYMFRHSLKVLQTVLLDFKDKLQTDGRRCCEAAIVFNDPKVLDRILKHLSTPYDLKIDQKYLYTVCSRLQRQECLEILSSHYGRRLEQANDSDEKYVAYMIGLLASYCDRLKDDIVPMLKQYPSTAAVMNSADRYRPSQLHVYLRNEFPRLDTGLMNSLFELGADLNVYAEKQTALHHLLSLQAMEQNLFYQKVRAAIEVFLNRNPDMEVYQNLKPIAFKASPIGLSVTIDLRLYLTPCKDKLDCSGTFTIDGNMHTYSGHETTDTYALNFFVPLLIECGMPYSREHLHDAPTKCLHPVEQEYIRNCLDTPRSLKLRCRDVLRMFYKGMRIHTFVQTSDIPQSLKDYILLKQVLLLCNK